VVFLLFKCEGFDDETVDDWVKICIAQFRAC